MSWPRRVPAPNPVWTGQSSPVEVARLWSTVDVAWVLRPLTARRRERSWQAELPDFAMRVSRNLRTGQSVDQTLIDAVADCHAPAHLDAVSSRLQAGQPIGDVIDGWVVDAPSEPERLLATAFAIGLRAGAQLAPILDGLAVAIRDELALDARRRVLLVQAQVSALVLVTMPVGFALVSSIMRGEFAYSGVLGMVLLVAGIVLDGIGVLWMRRLLRGLR